MDFAKTYDEVAVADYSILYAGTLTPDGMEIEGTWTIAGQRGRGTFLMVREGGAAVVEGLKAAETVRR